MNNMYNIIARGDLVSARLNLDNITVCSSCLEYYPLDKTIDITLAYDKPLKGVFNFAKAGTVITRTPSVDIAKKSFLEQLGWEDIEKNFVLGKVFYPKVSSKENRDNIDFECLEEGVLNDEWVTLRSRHAIQPRGKCVIGTARRICSECDRLIYWSYDEYLIDGTFDYDLIYVYCGLIIPERIFERIKDLNWKKHGLYAPRKFKILKKPSDGFPLDLREDCPVSSEESEKALDYRKKCE